MANSEELARSAVERLSEDEALRGDLSDIGFGPLLDWGTAAVMAYSQRAADAGAMDSYTERVRSAIREAVHIAETGKVENPEALQEFVAAGQATAQGGLEGLQLGDDPDSNAEMIAGLLQAALQAAAPAQPNVPAGEAPAPAPEVLPEVPALASEALPEAPAPQSPGNPVEDKKEDKKKDAPAAPPPAAAPPKVAVPPVPPNRPPVVIEAVKSSARKAWGSLTNLFKR